MGRNPVISAKSAIELRVDSLERVVNESVLVEKKKVEKKRLTVGCRARILQPAPKNKKDKRHFEDSWREHYPNMEIRLLQPECWAYHNQH